MYYPIDRGRCGHRILCPELIITLKGTKAWKNSGFSVDNTVRLYGNDNKAREALSQYIAKPPVSLEKLKYEPFYPSGTSHGKVLYKTPKYNDYFKENFKFFGALDFIAALTAHIPPKGKQYIRRYGLYSSRTRGVWQRMEFCVRLAPQGWREKYLDKPFRNRTDTRFNT